jgi:hypothetical protein
MAVNEGIRKKPYPRLNNRLEPFRNIKEQKLSGVKGNNQENPFALSQPRLTSVT